MARGLVRLLRRLALAGALGVGAIALVLARDGFEAPEAIVTVLLLAPSTVVLFLAQGVRELLALPERLRKAPGEGGQRLAELARLAGEARATRVSGVPRLLWRVRGIAGSLREVAGVALPLRVLTPGYLGLSALAALGCMALAGSGLIALLVLALG